MKTHRPHRKRQKTDIFSEFNLDKYEPVYVEPKEYTIITALDRVLDQARLSKLSDDFWTTVKRPMAYLREHLELTNIQIVLLAIMVEEGEPVSWGGFGEFLGTSRLNTMCYSEEIEELVTKRWLIKGAAHERDSYWEGFKLEHGVVTALRHNRPFVPEKLEVSNEQEFMDKLERHMSNKGRQDFNRENDETWMMQLVEANQHLALCQELQRYKDIHEKTLFLQIALDYAQYADSENEGLTLLTIDEIYPDDWECNCMRRALKNGTHTLMKAGLIEQKCEDGIANTELYVLTHKAKSELLSAYIPSRSQCLSTLRNNKSLKAFTEIKEKSLFYNSTEGDQIANLTDMLSQNNLQDIQQRLEEEGMRKGLTCLFYGAPGTGKTETVLQIARQTGRDIMQIDIAGLRNKFVGETEKNVKAIFTQYRKLCKNSDVMPILFFNEADAIFNKRTNIGGSNPTVEKMENSTQNIILQEMDNLDGILIATTNLTCNLDSAFDRRFLFKVQFKNPETDVKAKIWRTMLKRISESDALTLAKRYDFSGGQIENIARKQSIDYVLYGKETTLEDLDRYCKAELLDKGDARTTIGFKL